MMQKHKFLRTYVLYFIMALLLITRFNNLGSYFSLSIMGISQMSLAFNKAAIFGLSSNNDNSAIIMHGKCDNSHQIIERTLSGALLHSNIHRLRRLISWNCETNEQFIQRLYEDMNAGLTLDTRDIFLGGYTLLYLHGMNDAVLLFRQQPKFSKLLVDQGTMSIEKQYDPVLGCKFFYIAHTIDPTITYQKASMYRHLCIMEINRKSYCENIVEDPCIIFDILIPSTLSKILLGQWAYQHKNYMVAIRYFEEAISIDPFSPNAYYWLGRAYVSIGETDNAYITFQQGIEIAPEYEPNYLELINLLIDNGCYEQASEYLNLENFNMRSNIAELLASYPKYNDAQCRFP